MDYTAEELRAFTTTGMIESLDKNIKMLASLGETVNCMYVKERYIPIFEEYCEELEAKGYKCTWEADKFCKNGEMLLTIDWSE